MNFKGKRYTIWTDETLWSKTAIESGLTYGVWDNEKNDCCSRDEQGGIITSYKDAHKIAIEMNEAIEDKLKTH